MATPVNITSVQQYNNVNGTGGPFNATVSTTGSALVVYVGAYRASTTGELVDLPTASGLTFEVITDGTTSAKQLKATDSGGGSGRSGHYWFIARNVSSGTKSVTINFVNSSANYATAFACEVPRVPTSGTYCGKVVNASIAAGPLSVSATISTNLTQAKNTVLAAASGLGTNRWNNASSNDDAAPTGFTKLRAYYTNFPIDGYPFQASYQDVNSTAPITASWGVINDSLAEGFVTTIAALLDSAGTNYVEILLSPQTGITVNNSTGWTVEISAGDPKDGATIYTGVAAQSTGNELRVPAPAGTTVGQSINVVAYNTTLAHSGGTSVGTTRGVGTVRAGG